MIFSDEDILADSDSDGDDMEEDDDGLQEDILMDANAQSAERPKKKARRKDEKYIHEDADTIVDLADIKAMSKISCKLVANSKFFHSHPGWCLSHFLISFSNSIETR